MTRSRSPSTDRDLLLLRRFQEEALGGLGALSLAQIGLVQSACRHELVARLAGNWLKEANLSIQDRLALTQRITQATDARDRCFVRLGLSPAAGKGDAGAFDFLNSIPEPFEPQEATQ